MHSEFLKAILNRRSHYALSAESPIPDKALLELVETSVKHSPSAFHSQTGRVVVLLGREHKKLWDIVLETLRGVVPAESFGETEQRIGGFAAAYGSLLFFEEQETVKAMQEAFPLYAQNFPVWSEHAAGMLQIVLWTALEEAGFGASLQHYNPLIDDQVKAGWGLPESWKLVAQMPFGTITAPAGEKDFLPIGERVRVFGV